MPSTVYSYTGKLYHKSCLSPEELKDAVAVASTELEDDQACDECMELLTGEASPSDDEDDEDETEAS